MPQDDPNAREDAGVPAVHPTPPGADEAALAAVPMGPPRDAPLLPALPHGWSDPVTGVDGPRFWDRIVLSETARVRRYKRPATVVFAEIAELETLARLWGPDVAERALITTARTLGREIRSSDHIARLEGARFGMLLTETTEIAAINFVERARVACDRQVGAVALETITVAFGWASPPAKGDLGDAIELALRRLAKELAGA